MVAVRGVRVVTPASHVFAWEPLGKLFAWAERVACDAPLLRNLGGFLILVAQKKMTTNESIARGSAGSAGATASREDRNPPRVP